MSIEDCGLTTCDAEHDNSYNNNEVVALDDAINYLGQQARVVYNHMHDNLPPLSEVVCAVSQMVSPSLWCSRDAHGKVYCDTIMKYRILG